MRTIFIGDVHGCADELETLLAKCRVGREDRVVFVGDLVAKGPDSAGVVRRARGLGALAIRGNHDEHVLRWRAGSSPEGKALKPEHRQVLETLSPEDWAYLDALPTYLEFPELDVIAVHGGLVPGVPLEAQKRDDLLNLRSIRPDGTGSKRIDQGVAWASVWKGPGTVVFGHDAVRGFQRYSHAVGLDTGCVYGRALMAWVMPEDTLHVVPAKRAYVSMD